MGYNVRNVKARDRLVYGEVGFIKNGTTHPFTVSKLSSRFQQYQGELFWDGTQGNPANWRYAFDDFLKYCRVELQSFEANTQNLLATKIVRPESASNLVNDISRMGAVNSSTGLYTRDVKGVIYNDVSSIVPEVSKVYGYNAMYRSSLGGNSITKIYSIGDSPHNTNSPYLRDLIVQGYLEIFGVNVGTYYDANPELWKKCVWVPTSNHRYLYSLPGGGTINAGYPDPTGRRYARNALIVGQPVISPTGANFTFASTKIAATIRTETPYMGLDISSKIKEVTSDVAPKSSVILYGLTNGSYQALYMKPLGGIDTICVPKYNTNEYRLEAAFDLNGKRTRYKIIDVPESTGSSNGHDFYTERIRKDQFYLGKERGLQSKKSDTPYNGWNIRFYMRDLISGDVSRLSDMGIRAEFARKAGLSFVDFKIHRF